MRLISFAAVLAVAMVFSGCATSRKAGWESGGDGPALSREESAQVLSEAKAAWGNREKVENLEKAISLFEKYAASNPTNLEALVYISRGKYLLAEYHIENMDERKKVWESGTSWGERAMALNPGFKKKVADEGESVEDALGELGKEHVDAIYWTAVNLGKWAKNSGIGTTLKYKGRLQKMIQRVEALNPNFFHGAVYRYWGTYYAVAPGFAGGSMEKSLENYEKSVKAAPNYLGTYTLYAENYAVKKGDRALFDRLLKKVLDTKPETLPDLVAEQRWEQKRARELQAKAGELF